MVLLSVIIEYFSIDEIKVYYDNLNQIIEGHLKSGVPSLQSLAIETVNKIAQNPKAIKILRKYKNLIPLVLQALSLDQEEMIQKVFEMLNEFAEVKKVLGPHIKLLVEAAIKISRNTDYSVNLREVTMLFLEQVAENYSRILIKRGHKDLIEQVIETGFIIASENEQDFEGEEENPHTLALYLIFSYADEVPNEIVFPIIMKYVNMYGTSKKELERKASIKILGYICDTTCMDMIKDDIDEITDFIVAKLHDPSVKKFLNFLVLSQRSHGRVSR